MQSIKVRIINMYCYSIDETVDRGLCFIFRLFWRNRTSSTYASIQLVSLRLEAHTLLASRSYYSGTRHYYAVYVLGGHVAKKHALSEKHFGESVYPIDGYIVHTVVQGVNV